MTSPNLSTGNPPTDKLCVFRAIVGNSPVQENAPRRCRCVYCGFVCAPTSSHEEKIFRTCDKDQSQLLSTDDVPWLAQRALNYATAYAKHVSTGKRILPADHILARFLLCSTCPNYNASLGLCGICGCFVNTTDGKESPNKLAWASEECPLPGDKKRFDKEQE